MEFSKLVKFQKSKQTKWERYLKRMLNFWSLLFLGNAPIQNVIRQLTEIVLSHFF